MVNATMDDSLQSISGQSGDHSLFASRTVIATGMGLVAVVATIVALLRLTHLGQPIRKKLTRRTWKSGLYDAARDAAAYATDKVDVSGTRDATLEVMEQISSKLNDLATQLAALKPKTKRKRFWFA